MKSGIVGVVAVYIKDYFVFVSVIVFLYFY